MAGVWECVVPSRRMKRHEVAENEGSLSRGARRVCRASVKVLLGATLDMLTGESPKRPFSLAQPRQGKCGSSSVVQVCQEERGG